MGVHHTVNSEITWTAFVANARELYDLHKYVTFVWRIGADRSLDQNALWHVWLTEWIAYKLGKAPKQVTKKELAGIKKTVKRLYYLHSAADFMVHEIIDYSTGRVSREFTSSADWGRGEMYDVLTYLQLIAAEDGCVLEAVGEFAKLKRDQAA